MGKEAEDNECNQHWITATFTTTLVRPSASFAVSSMEDREWERQELLVSERCRHFITNSIPDICSCVWVSGQRILQPSTLYLTPPQSPDKAIEDVEKGMSRLFILSNVASTDDVTADTKPNSLCDYITDIVARLHLRGSHLIVAVILLERLRHCHSLLESGSNSAATFTTKCSLQAFIFCLLMAHKLCEDRAYDNRTWAHLTRYSVSDINRMERRLLCLIEHRMYVEGKELEAVFDVLDNKYGWRQMLRLSKSQNNTMFNGGEGRRSSRAL